MILITRLLQALRRNSSGAWLVFMSYIIHQIRRLELISRHKILRLTSFFFLHIISPWQQIFREKKYGLGFAFTPILTDCYCISKWFIAECSIFCLCLLAIKKKLCPQTKTNATQVSKIIITQEFLVIEAEQDVTLPQDSCDSAWFVYPSLYWQSTWCIPGSDTATEKTNFLENT